MYYPLRLRIFLFDTSNRQKNKNDQPLDKDMMRQVNAVNSSKIKEGCEASMAISRESKWPKSTRKDTIQEGSITDISSCLPLRNIPVQITPNIHTPSISPLSHLTPHPPSSNVQVHEDREEEPVDYKLLTAVQVTGKGKELSGDIPTVAIPSSSSSFAPYPAGPSLPQRRLTLRDWCQPRKAAVRRRGW